MNQKAERIILGIDPGTNVMGYGVIRVVGNKAEMVAMGVIDLHKIPICLTRWPSRLLSSARTCSPC